MHRILGEYRDTTGCEILEALSEKPAPINLHLYQPPRQLSLSIGGRVGKVFDISGKNGSYQGFNHQITEESYRPLIERGILSDPNVSWDLYGVTADWMEVYHPELIFALRKQIDNGASFPVGDSYLHIILPFLSEDHVDMLLKIGRSVYQEHWGELPDTIWLPESAVSQSTLESLVRNNFMAVHLREHQLRSNEGSNLYTLNTKEGKIIAISANNHLSGNLGFDKPWADNFYSKWASHSSQIGYCPRLSVDGETLGHWWKNESGVFEFAKFLLKYLKEGNGLDFKTTSLPDAELVGNTSWSCLDNGLGRWSGSHDCSCQLPNNDHEAKIVRSAKKDLFEKLMIVNTRVDRSLDEKLPDWREIYIEWFKTQRHNLATGNLVSADFIGNSELEKLFLCAYTRDIGWTSCGWFFGDVGGYERQIPANSLRAISEIMNWPEIMPAY